MSENFVDVGKRIEYMLKKLNLKQIEACKKIGMSKSSLNNYISGNRVPDNEATLKLAKLFNVSMEWLLTGEGLSPGNTLENDNLQISPNIQNLTPGERLKLLRIKAGMTAEQLAEKLNLPLDIIIHWEEVDPLNYEVIEIFAAYYNIPDVWIKYGVESPYDAEYKVVDEDNSSETSVLKRKDVNTEESTLLDMFRALPRHDKDEINAMISFKHSRLKGIKKKTGFSTSGHEELAASELKIG